MTRFEFFESGQALIAAKIGVIPIDLLTKYDSYRTYRDYLAEGFDQAKARLLASDQCRCHYSSIVRAIYWFERDDPNYTDLRTRSWRSKKHLRIVENKQDS
jgi:hypothetical protein